MATSHYFNHFSPASTSEQRLHEDLVGESIRIMGHDVWYIPRDSYDTIDALLGENINSKFDRAYKIEMYIANVEGYEGDGDFFSKFGLEIRDTSNFIVARRAFERYIPSVITPHPREGDLIYVPVFGKMFEIKFVEEEMMFHSIGRRVPIIYELRCEAFRFSQEDISTGVEEVDQVDMDNSYTIQLALGDGTGNYLVNERVYQLYNNVRTAEATVTYWEPVPKKVKITNIKGDFINLPLIGNSSNAVYNVVTFNVFADVENYDQTDNSILETEAEIIIDTSENDPFSGGVLS